MHYFFVVFLTVFLAELGDKTQIATLLFATERENSPYLVFAAAAGARIASTALAVFLGTVAERFLVGVPLKLIAGGGFIAIGLWTLSDHFAHA
jgi:putative Ca2+/H+ antiporter (TMEM165/GDT1 family)